VKVCAVWFSARCDGISFGLADFQFVLLCRRPVFSQWRVDRVRCACGVAGHCDGSIEVKSLHSPASRLIEPMKAFLFGAGSSYGTLEHSDARPPLSKEFGSRLSKQRGFPEKYPNLASYLVRLAARNDLPFQTSN